MAELHRGKLGIYSATMENFVFERISPVAGGNALVLLMPRLHQDTCRPETCIPDEQLISGDKWIHVAVKRIKTRTHVVRYKLYPLVCTCRRLHVSACVFDYVQRSCSSLYRLLRFINLPIYITITSCIGDKIVASLSLVCCWIQRDTSRP